MEDNKRSKVFIANVDEYDQEYIAKFLSQAIVGQTQKSDDDEALEEENEKPIGKTNTAETYAIYGTLKNHSKGCPSYVKCLIDEDNRQNLFNKLIECDFIIYNIKDDRDLIDEALWIMDKLHETRETFKVQKMFILISSILTWARSILPDENDPDMPFTDEDYLRRKPHSNFKEHIFAEKTIIQQGKTNKLKLLTYVIASGLTYGETENVFHHLFKAAWNNSSFLEIPGNGQNVLPVIHVRDLGRIVQAVMEMRPTKHYILAKDDSSNTLQDIVKIISKTLSTGKVKHITKEEALFCRELTQNQLDHLLVSLRMDAGIVKELLPIKWQYESGLVENINQLVKEFKLSRQLIPIRLCILGPPASGKSILAKRLSEYYKIPHIHIKGVIDETLMNLEKRLQTTDGEKSNLPNTTTTIGNDDDEDEQHDAEADAQLWEAVLQNMEENNGRLDLNYVTEFFQNKLNSKPCQNQGYIIDGYPKSKKQAIALFSPGGMDNNEEEEQEQNEEEDEGKGEQNEKNLTGNKLENESISPAELFVKKYLPPETELANVTNEPSLLPTQPIPNQLPKGLLPNYIFELEASDNFLKNRVMNMPEELVHGTHYNEIDLWRRLNEYRINQLGLNPTTTTTAGLLNSMDLSQESQSTDSNPLNSLGLASISENSVRAYFDTKGVLQIPINVMTDKSPDLEDTFRKIIYFIGPPRNYGLTEEELQQQMRQEQNKQTEMERLMQEEIDRKNLLEERAQEKRRKEWITKQKNLENEEKQLLDQQSEPLRMYLKKHIMPVLAKGLNECIKKRPDDPIDFLAEYLFFNNPQVD